MERWVGRVALITGASSGIGAAIAKSLVLKGMKVIGCSRDITRIQEMAADLKDGPGNLEAIKCDLRDESQILNMFEIIKRKYKGVDLMVNNAGLAWSAHLLTGETSLWKHMYDVNVLAPMICTREAFKSMQERDIDDGHIIYINSTAGHRVVNNADSHCYTATKFALHAVAEGVRNELRNLKTHIRSTSICPGYVETNFHERKYDKEKAKLVYGRFKCLEPADMVAAVIYALEAPPHVQVHDMVIRPTDMPL